MNLNPLGQGGDFVAFPVVGDVGYMLEHATDFQESERIFAISGVRRTS